MTNLRHIYQLERYDNIIQYQIKEEEDFVETIDKICEQKIAEREKVFH